MSSRNVSFIFIRREIEKAVESMQKQDFDASENMLLELIKKTEPHDILTEPEDIYAIAKIYYLLGCCQLHYSRSDETLAYFEKSYEILIAADKHSSRSAQALFLELAAKYAKLLSSEFRYKEAVKRLEPAIKYSKKLSQKDYFDLIIPLYLEYSSALNNLGYRLEAMKAVNYALRRLKRIYFSQRQYLIKLVQARCIKSDIIIRHALFKSRCLNQINLAIVNSWYFVPGNISEPESIFLETMKYIGNTIFEFTISPKKSRGYTDAIAYANSEAVNGDLVSLIPATPQEEFFIACEEGEYKERKPDELFLLYFFYDKLFKYLSYVLREEQLSNSQLRYFGNVTKLALFSIVKSLMPVTNNSEIMYARYRVLLAEFYLRRKKLKAASESLDKAFNVYSSLISKKSEINIPKAMYAFCFIQERRAHICELLNKKKNAAALYEFTADFLNDIEANLPLLTLTRLIIMMRTRSALSFDNIGDYEKSAQNFSSAVDVFEAYQQQTTTEEAAEIDSEILDEIIDCAALNYFRRGTAKTKMKTRNYASALRDYLECAELLKTMSDDSQTSERLGIVYRAISEIYEAFGETKRAKQYHLLFVRLTEKNPDPLERKEETHK